MAVDRTHLPAVVAAKRFSPPAFNVAMLPGGQRVWTLSHRRAPVLTFRLLVPVGSADDPIGKTGLASLTAALLDEGTEDRSAIELHQTLMHLGGHLAVQTSSDMTVISLTTLPKHATRALDLLVEVVSRPRFSPADCERVRELRRTRLRQMRHVPSAIAGRTFLGTVYPDHPYGHMAIGTDDDLRQMSDSDVTAFHQRWYAPERWTVIAVGDVSDTDLLELFSRALPGAPATETPRAPRPSAPVPTSRLVFVPRPRAAQSEIRIGHVMPPRATPDYHALLVLNVVLGGQFVSRMNLNLREDKGYTYGARTSIDWRLGPSAFSVQSSVQSDATVDAIGEAIRELREIRRGRPVTDHELNLARAALCLGFPRGFETASQLARAGASLALHQLPVDDLSQFVDRITAVDADAVSRVAERHLRPDSVAVVVVGADDGLGASLEHLGLGAATMME